MTTKISEAKFEALKSKLRELFELDKSDLDFGIYRIMAAKNKEVTAFLDRHLRESVREVLESRGSDESTKLAGEIAKAREAAATAGFNPDDSPKVKELEEQYAKLGSGSTEELEADIYNHLLNFFSRYYDEGDFISKRFYKGDTYAIPYSGEEVTLHWANKDQYYIKSGEWHKDYRFRIDGKAVHFRLVEATGESGNNKEPDESKRRYILTQDTPVTLDEANQILTLRFEFRAPSSEDERRVEQAEPTRIFGGNYDKNSGRTKGDQRELYCADAEMRALQAVKSDWRKAIQTPAPTPSKPSRTALGKHLDHFTARNSFDYFVHKNLGAFLRRELDFYIKNEVLRLDDLESDATSHLQWIGIVGAVRRVAHRLIDLLSKIEDFQKKILLKKKFVFEANWLISVDKVPAELLRDVATNASQWTSWKKQGLMPGKDEPSLLNEAEWGTEEYLSSAPGLVVDTRLFPSSFKDRIISCLDFSAKIQPNLAINGENFQAMRLIHNAYSGRGRTLYLDPPYNTDGGPILYKNGYRSSTWASLMADRLLFSRELLSPTCGILCATIDDYQQTELHYLIRQIYGSSGYAGTVAIRINP